MRVGGIWKIGASWINVYVPVSSSDVPSTIDTHSYNFDVPWYSSRRCDTSSVDNSKRFMKKKRCHHSRKQSTQVSPPSSSPPWPDHLPAAGAGFSRRRYRLDTFATMTPGRYFRGLPIGTRCRCNHPQIHWVSFKECFIGTHAAVSTQKLRHVLHPPILLNDANIEMTSCQRGARPQSRAVSELPFQSRWNGRDTSSLPFRATQWGGLDLLFLFAMINFGL